MYPALEMSEADCYESALLGILCNRVFVHGRGFPGILERATVHTGSWVHRHTLVHICIFASGIVHRGDC